MRLFPSFPSRIHNRVVGHSVAVQKVPIQPVHDSSGAALRRESGLLFYHYLLTRILHGSTAVPPPVSRLNLTSFGRYLCLGSKVCVMIKYQHSVADQILAGRMPTATVRQRKDENPNITLMHIGLIAGTPVHPKLAFSVDLLELFYHLRRRQPSIGVQGFIKATCTFQQVYFPLSVHLRMTNYSCH